MPPPEGSIPPHSFRQVLSNAVADLAEHGYQSGEQVDRWLLLLRAAAERELGSEAEAERMARDALIAIYRRLIEAGRIVKYVPEVSRFTLAIVRPELRAELDRRILAAADLIKLRRRESIEKTLARFQGWSTSIPPGGEGVIDRREVRASVAKSLQQERFLRRRVQIDQGAKLLSNIADIVAIGNGAIAAEWRHIPHRKGYQARPEHVARNGKIYGIRDSWAWEQGLISKSWPTTDEIDRPGQAIFCSCTFRYILSPRRLPDAMLTKRGQQFVAGELETKAA